ncbi:Alsin [Trichoplax sp. H2]|nr:Alsin [Trichoplax sp. H2]|eukprot:RDD45065.1 Alsin [Trichoplax sp. H2]
MEGNDSEQEECYQVYEEGEQNDEMKVYRWDHWPRLPSPRLVASFRSSRRIERISLGQKHTLMLTNDGQIFALGNNNYGQLGLDDLSDRKCFTLLPLFRQMHVTFIAAGSQHSCCINDGGQLYSWGDNAQGQCGVGDDLFYQAPVQVSVCSPSDLQICSCGGDHPSRIELVQVACGKAHTITVSSNGQCWTWGQGCDYGLADDDASTNAKPLCVNELSDEFVTQVDCGLFHNILVSYRRHDVDSPPVTPSKITPPNRKNNKVDSTFNATRNTTPIESKRKTSRSGSSSNINPFPAFITPPDTYSVDYTLTPLNENSDSTDANEDFILISPKPRSSTFTYSQQITQVWTWGNNNYGQLGLGDKTARHIPCCIESMKGLAIKQVSAGGYHSIAFTSDCQLYAWGRNSNGQLGVSGEISLIPRQVELSIGVDQRVSGVATGEDNTSLLTFAANQQNQIYRIGNIVTDKKTTYANITVPKEDYICAIASNYGQSCFVSARNENDDIRKILHELLIQDRILYCQITTAKKSILSPIKQTEYWKNIRGVIGGNCLRKLFETFEILMTHIDEFSDDLEKVIITQEYLNLDLKFLERNSLLSIYIRYATIFLDAVSVDIITRCANSAWQSNEISLAASSELWKIINNYYKTLPLSELSTSLKSFVSEYMPKSLFGSSLSPKSKNAPNTRSGGSKETAKSHETLLEQFLYLPLNRLKYVIAVLSGLIQKFSTIPSSDFTKKMLKLVRNLSSRWQSLSNSLHDEYPRAEITKQFWRECSPKLREHLCIPQLRLILSTSKKNPLQYSKSGRFTNYNFILFNRVFVRHHTNSCFICPLTTLWIDPDEDTNSANSSNIFTLITPEETLELSASSSIAKSEWLRNIKQAVLSSIASSPYAKIQKKQQSGSLLPQYRYAEYLFNSGDYKDAKYLGWWFAGKLHGHGEMKWNDGSVYIGQFKKNLFHGLGQYTTLSNHNQNDVFVGEWRTGRKYGYGTMKYANGDEYNGFWYQDMRHGHGIMKQGTVTNVNSSFYIGEWLCDNKAGYGIYDHKGKRYMGIWSNDTRHGEGVVITLDGIFLAGSFSNDRLVGNGILLTDDKTKFVGEFSSDAILSGKGVLTLPNGNYIEGSFNGKWGNSIKINGSFYKQNMSDLDSERSFYDMLPSPSELSSEENNYAVNPDKKWESLFLQFRLVIGAHRGKIDSKSAWQNITDGMEKLKNKPAAVPALPISRSSQSIGSDILDSDVDLTVAPDIKGTDLQALMHYLSKAFDDGTHPLGRLVDSLVEAFRYSYLGIAANHRLLLPHAIGEAKSMIRRLYESLRILFPDLPVDGELAVSNSDDDPQLLEAQETVSSISLLHPLILPRIYPPLFTLYALNNETEEESYKRKLRRLAKYTDLILMRKLGINKKFRLIPEKDENGEPNECENCLHYTDAISTLQQISTKFSPMQKLLVVKDCFSEIFKAVDTFWNDSGTLKAMDDILPVFHFVVVRAEISQLGSEILFIQNMVDDSVLLGELDMMFTTLQACYFQIKSEEL